MRSYIDYILDLLIRKEKEDMQAEERPSIQLEIQDYYITDEEEDQEEKNSVIIIDI